MRVVCIGTNNTLFFNLDSDIMIIYEVGHYDLCVFCMYVIVHIRIFVFFFFFLTNGFPSECKTCDIVLRTLSLYTGRIERTCGTY